MYFATRGIPKIRTSVLSPPSSALRFVSKSAEAEKVVARFVILRRVYPRRPICPAVDKTRWQWRPMAVGRRPSLRADMPRPAPFPLRTAIRTTSRILGSIVNNLWILCTCAALRSIVAGEEVNIPGEEFCDFFLFPFHTYIYIRMYTFFRMIRKVCIYYWTLYIWSEYLIISIISCYGGIANGKKINK